MDGQHGFDLPTGYHFKLHLTWQNTRSQKLLWRAASAYESGNDPRNWIKNKSGWKGTWKNSDLTGNRSLTIAMACSPVGLISLMDRALRPVIAQVRLLFLVKSEFFPVPSQPLRLCIQLRWSHPCCHFHIFIRSSKYETLHVFPFRDQCTENPTAAKIERFSFDLETKTREQNRNNKRTEIERFHWLSRAWLLVG